MNSINIRVFLCSLYHYHVNDLLGSGVIMKRDEYLRVPVNELIILPLAQNVHPLDLLDPLIHLVSSDCTHGNRQT